MAILDADKEGSSVRSGRSSDERRAPASPKGHHTPITSPGHPACLDETRRRRSLQERFNREHGITPATIRESIHDVPGPSTGRLRHRATVAEKKGLRTEEEIAA